MKKKLLILFFVFAAVLCIKPAFNVTASAETSGSTGHCKWKLDGTVLTIFGEGQMGSPGIGEQIPWGYDITKVVVEEGVTSIGRKAFNNCDLLTEVVLADSVTAIYDQAFLNCTALSEITIPDSVTKLGTHIFSGCSGLKSISLPYAGYYVESGSTKTYYPLGYLFGKESFDGAELTQQQYCSGSTQGATVFEKYYVPKSLTHVTVRGGSVALGAFYNCKNLVSVVLKEKVTGIENLAFYACDSLKILNAENEDIKIAYQAWYKSDNILYNAFDNGLYLGSAENPYMILAKAVTKDILSIEIHEDTKIIAPSAFLSCNLLEEVNLPEGTRRIGEYSFGGCSAITEITIPDGVTEIPDNAFRTCTGLTRVNYLDRITRIGSYAFDGCASLLNIELGNQITSIGDHAFSFCTSLTELYLPDSVETISAQAFEACTALELAHLGKNIRSIGHYAFNSCSSLKDVILSDSIKSIQIATFSNLKNFTDVWYMGSETDRENISILKQNTALTDATWHYETCKDEHTYSAPCDESCNACEWIRTDPADHAYDNACDATCNACGEAREVPDHAYDNVCDATCNVCGAVREASDHTYDGVCDGDCNVCGTSRFAPHAYDSAADLICNLCGYERPVPGDFDRSEAVTVDDAIYLLFHLSFPEHYPVWMSVDFDGSGQVDLDDAFYLLLYVFFPDRFPLS
ncbi:MAG: leucine-rich repeat domain-containing protein [Clostridia bacterium]|nr:leucine-rich repeat domain-containing protein [Clostridia bacterium]